MRPFGQLLEEYLEKAKIKQTDAAKTLEVNRSYITHLISGHKHPTYEKIQALTTLLNLTKSEELDFYIAAIEDKTSTKMKAFISHVNTLTEDLKTVHRPTITKSPALMEIQAPKLIPITKCPHQKQLPPYQEEDIIDQFANNEIINENFYAIRYNDHCATEGLDFKKGDLIIINPLYKTLKSGDLVLCKIHDTVSLRTYQLLQLEGALYIQFGPKNTEDTSLYKVASQDDCQSEEFEIFGKVVFAIKKY